jgi:CRISPR/Cas system-associated endonuclease Cas1
MAAALRDAIAARRNRNGEELQMYHNHMKRCLQWLDARLYGRASKRRTQAKAVGRSQRTVSRYRRLVEQALASGAASAPRSSSHSTSARRRQAQKPSREPDLHRLGRCAQLLEMEHSPVRTTVHALAAQFAVDKRTIFRDLDLIEEATGRRSQLVPRRANRKKG